MKKLFYRLLPAAFSLLALAAAIGVKPACLWAWHQPEVPKSLLK
ncbi:cyclic lactone autoinducer peptide [Moorellaceae bacterium AZ2]